MKFVEHRIADRRILRLIRKWLRAGVSEDGTWSKSEVGTPQGAVASPLLANIYLHYAFDLWVQHWRTHRATGEIIVVRYADDIVLGFEHRSDAERFLQQWQDRMRQFGLELHPDKTRLMEFGRHAAGNRKQRGESKPEVFDFPGIHPYLWENPEDWPVHRQAEDDSEATHGKTPCPRRGASTAMARTGRRCRAVVEVGRQRLAQLSCDTRQYGLSEQLSQPGCPALVSRPSAAEPTPSDHLGPVSPSDRPMDSKCQDLTSASQRAI